MTASAQPTPAAEPPKSRRKDLIALGAGPRVQFDFCCHHLGGRCTSE